MGYTLARLMEILIAPVRYPPLYRRAHSSRPKDHLSRGPGGIYSRARRASSSYIGDAAAREHTTTNPGLPHPARTAKNHRHDAVRACGGPGLLARDTPARGGRSRSDTDSGVGRLALAPRLRSLN